jgi:p-cumate 2,3-dioxygenase subunit beta
MANEPTSVQQVEAFLYAEAALLDSLQFQEWFGLFTDDAHYLVPPTDLPDADPATTLFLINDDHTRLGGRVKRLQSRDAHADYPHPRTRRLITNVRILSESEGELTVAAAFVVYAMRVGRVNPFIGEYRYVLRVQDGDFRIALRRAALDIESLDYAGGKVNIIV